MNNLSNVSINHLPVEIFVIIFKKLNLQDKYLSCSLVCKFWLDIIKGLREDCLVVSDRVCVNEIWFHTNTSVSVHNQVYPLSYDFLPEQQVRSTFLRLKKLFIYFGLLEDELNFDITINKFELLEHLELKYVNIKNESNLILPNLVYFAFSTIASYQKLRLTTPELKYMKCNFHNVEYEFDNLDKLTYLEVDECKPMIEKFKNLECLIAKKFNKIQLTTLINLPKLKQIHNIGFNCLFGFQELIFFKNLYEQKQQAKRTDLNLYIYGLNYEIMKMNAFAIYGPNLTPWYSNNFSNLIDVIPYEDKFHFNKFEFNDNLELLNSVTTKFPNIKHVFGEKFGENEELFLIFLKNCKHLNKLNMSLPFKNEDSYNKLTAYCPTLAHLEIGITGPKSQFIDLKFILHFSYLCYFSINQEVDLNIVRSAFKLKYMKFFKFDFDNFDERQLCFVTVQKQKSWKLEYKNVSEKFESLDRLIDFYELKKAEDESFYL